MNVRNNYNECLTNLACSIRKYFGLNYKHKTLDCVDKILEEKNPENVVLILFDGMGSRIMERTLDRNDFFIVNNVKNLTTVFPATTTAATTSLRTGLNPSEHGWLGWNTYIAPIDKTISLFLNSEKGKEDTCLEFLKVKNKLVTKTIIDEINELGIYKAVELFPFGENKYNDFNEMLNIIENETKKEGKKFIYAYDDEPDHTMHDLGPDNEVVKNLIKLRNDKIEELSNKLNNTLIIVVADHGHIVVEPIYLKDYPDLHNMLERTTSIESRAISFKIKPNYKEKFIERFNELFNQDFALYEKEEVLKSKLFGDGNYNELFEDAIGDFIAIAENSNKYILDDGDLEMFSHHSGYTDDEIYVPLIIVDKC